MFKVFANSPGDQGSNLRLVIPKSQKTVLDASFLYSQHYHVCIMGKWSNPEKLVALSPTLRCRSY